MGLFKKVLSVFISLACSSALITTVSADEHGVDISKYQGDINWQEFSKNNLDFAILRAGTTKYGIDTKFEEYYRGAKSIGLKTGAYLFCSSYELTEFRDAAYTFLNYLDGKTWEMPVYLDYEEDYQPGLGKRTLTSYILATANIVSYYGYTTGVYSNKNWFTNYIDREAIERAGYEIWWAQYPDVSKPVNPYDYDLSNVCGIWQYSSLGVYSGVTGSTVDMNIAYKSYPEDATAVIFDVPEMWITKNKTETELRFGPGLSYEVMFAIPGKSVINVKETKEADGKLWGKVKYGGYVGWCQLDNASKVDSSPEYAYVSPSLYDIDCDGFIKANDEYELKKYILTYNSGLPGDNNLDTKTNVFDMIRMKRMRMSY